MEQFDSLRENYSTVGDHLKRVRSTDPSRLKGFGPPPSSLKPRKLKYQKGANACGNCKLNHHRTCRPKLDGTVCSCSCSRAAAMRHEVEANGGDVIEAARVLAPQYRQEFFTSEESARQ